MKAESFFNALRVVLWGEFAEFDDADIHGIRVMSFGEGRERLVELVSGFGVLFGDFISTFPLGLERDGFLVPVVDGGGNSVHGHNMAHEGRRDAGRKYPIRMFWSMTPVREE